jgi:hypothetical protein
MADLLLVVLGFLLGLIPGWWGRRSRLKVHWGALRAEIGLCREKAETYLTDNVMAPLYRFPLKAYETSLPVLLADAAVDEQAVRKLLQFYGQVEDLNRGLDNAAQLAMDNNTGPLKSEYKRNCSKAEQLLEPPVDSTNLYSNALQCIERQLS